jgi:hypothetical protein
LFLGGPLGHVAEVVLHFLLPFLISTDVAVKLLHLDLGEALVSRTALGALLLEGVVEVRHASGDS